MFGFKQYLFLFLCFTGLSAFAQINSSGQPEKRLLSEDTETEILLRHEASGGAILHSNGWGVNGRRAKHKTAKLWHVWELDIVSMKHPKEFKSVNPYFENSKGYVYGKQYSLLLTRLGFGHKRVLYHKEDRKGGGVEVRWHYYGGASIGFAKPVYLEILTPTVVPFEFTLATERYNPDEHYIDNIYGKAPFSKGINELKVYPGLYIKSGVSFDYAPRQDKVSALEAGIVLDGYYKKVPLMALTENKQFFLSFYISLHFGGKWY